MTTLMQLQDILSDRLTGTLNNSKMSDAERFDYNQQTDEIIAISKQLIGNANTILKFEDKRSAGISEDKINKIVGE